jgi:transcriptional regulator with XRE-family HTH domain
MTDTLTANQVVAFNLRRARELRGLTQDQAAERLEPFLGQRWSKTTFSGAERSIAGDRIREFTANEIHAFAKAFQVTLSYFLVPPENATVATPGGPEDAAGGFVEALLAVDATMWERLIEFPNAPPMRALRTPGSPGYSAELAETVEEAERQVAHALGVLGHASKALRS